jgi:protein required for attachment to host cells
MIIPTDTLVLVADGKRMLFLRNRGDAIQPDLRVEEVEKQDNPYQRDQARDEPGRAFAGFGAHRAAYNETDFHKMAEDNWAKDAAERLNKRALAKDFEQLVIAAPPKWLGELRKHLRPEVTNRVLGYVNKDLTHEPTDQLARHLAELE